MTGKPLSLRITDGDNRSSDREGSLSPELSPLANETEIGELSPLAETEGGDSSDSSDLEDASSCSVIPRSVS